MSAREHGRGTPHGPGTPPHGPGTPPHGPGTPPDGLRGIWDDPNNVRWFLRIFWGLAVLLCVTEPLMHLHDEHALEGIPVFYALYGFVGVAVLILLSKGLRRLVMRSEDYYDAE